MGFFAYNSVKLIRVESPLLVLIYYLLILAVLVYVVAYTIIIQKGYQEYDTLVGSTMIKTKGVAFYDTTPPPPVTTAPPALLLQNNANIKSPLPPVQLSQNSGGGFSSSWSKSLLEDQSLVLANFDSTNIKFYDANDLVLPPLVPGGFFVATTLVETPSQTRSTCPGNDKKLEVCNCSRAGGVSECCKAGTTTNNGVKLGTCSSGGDFCDIQGWCPLEDESKPVSLDGVANWTVMIRVNANFPNFKQQLSNTGSSELELGTNLFAINDLVSMSGNDYGSLKAKGALLLMSFKYDCDLNKAIANCKPQITVSRLDQNSSLSTGFNYRLINKYHISSVEYRDLSKVYGLRVLVSVEGRGGRFSASVLSTTIGAGLALLGVAAVICDFVIQYLLPERQKILSKKFEEIADDPEEGGGRGLSEGKLLPSGPDSSR